MSDAANRITGRNQPGPILIVEDNPIFREGLATMLLREGYPVIQASNGQHALDHLRCFSPPALILLDMFMPVMDGWVCIRECRRLALPLPPVIIMTGLAIATEEWAHALGAVGLLHKPFTVETLLKEVGRHYG